MNNIDIKEEKQNLKTELEVLRKMELDHLNLMLFLKDIRYSLNTSNTSYYIGEITNRLQYNLDLLEMYD